MRPRQKIEDSVLKKACMNCTSYKELGKLLNASTAHVYREVKKCKVKLRWKNGKRLNGRFG